MEEGGDDRRCISHLIYLDDAITFFSSSRDQLWCLRSVLLSSGVGFEVKFW